MFILETGMVIPSNKFSSAYGNLFSREIRAFSFLAVLKYRMIIRLSSKSFGHDVNKGYLMGGEGEFFFHLFACSFCCEELDLC